MNFCLLNKLTNTITKAIGNFLFASASIKRMILAGTIMTGTLSLQAQIYSADNPGNFGIDGDIFTSQKISGSFNAAGTDDWFSKAGASGLSMFDNLDPNNNKSKLSSGTNISFYKKMQWPAYSTQNGNLMLDGTYARDYFGFVSADKATKTLDNTVFVSTQQISNKNHANPSSWSTLPDGGSLPSKADLVDTYITMRRMGNNGSTANPSHLIVYMAAATIGTEGTRYLDFELFKSTIDYDTKTGLFVNSAPAITGGRNAWQFDTDGSIRTSGDMTLSFSFGSESVTDIAIYIWTDFATTTAISPTGFNFVQGSWSGPANNSGYGYIKIAPKSGGTLPAWGAVNTVVTQGPNWGTTSKELSAPEPNKYYSTHYSIGQFAETAIDLTAIGVDAAFSKTFNPCSPAYRRVMMKTRSSDSFSSALQDFAGPFEFLDVPYLSPAISGTPLIDCRQPTSSLKPTYYLNTGIYSWSTKDGHITSRTDTAFITVNKGGKYYLRATAYGNCNSNIDSFIVKADLFQPVATANVHGSIVQAGDSVLLQGGDPIASNTANPTASSKGLLWNWSGPANFTATKQNVYAKEYGDYRLIVTEVRNGCTDTATASVFNAARFTLPITFRSVSASAEKNSNKSIIQWQVDVEEEYLKHFEVEKSNDGKMFFPVGYVYGKPGVHQYKYEDNNTNEAAYYRVKAIGSISTIYSKVVMMSNKPNTMPQFHLDKTNHQAVIQFHAKENTALQIQIISANGQVVQTAQAMANLGTNHIKVPFSFYQKTAFYIVRIATAQNNWTFKIVN